MTDNVCPRRPLPSDTLPIAVPDDTPAALSPPDPLPETPALVSDPTLAEDIVHFEGAAPAGTPLPALDGTLSAWLFQPDCPPTVFPLADLASLVHQDANFVWLDLSAYSASDLHALVDGLSVHPVAVRATLAAWQRPRFDTFRDHFFVSTTVARVHPGVRRVYAGELDLFVGNNFLVSVHKHPMPFAARLLARAQQSPELVTLDSAFMLYVILDELLEYYEELSDHIEEENERMEQRALKDTSEEFLTELLQLKRYIFALSRIADQHRRVFAALVRPDSPLAAHAEVMPYFHDLEAHFERLLDTLVPAKEAVNGAFDIYVSHVAHRTNQIMKVLTMVSTVLLPATVIIGIFSTNIQGIPLYEPTDFGVMLGVIGVVIGLVLFFFWRQGWIKFPKTRGAV